MLQLEEISKIGLKIHECQSGQNVTPFHSLLFLWMVNLKSCTWELPQIYASLSNWQLCWLSAKIGLVMEWYLICVAMEAIWAIVQLVPATILHREALFSENGSPLILSLLHLKELYFLTWISRIITGKKRFLCPCRILLWQLDTCFKRLGYIL